MATSSQTIIPGFTLTGSTPGNSTAPVTFTLNGISLGQQTDAGGFEYTAARNSDGTYTVYVAGKFISSTVPGGQFESLLAGLRPAAAEIERTITGQATTVTPITTATTPAPTATTTSDPYRAPPPIDSSLEGSPQYQAQVAAEAAAAPTPAPNTPSAEEQTRTVAIQQDQIAFNARADWRVRLSLTDDTGAKYLYLADNAGILEPLKQTKGVIFPYTPQISVNYAANYSPTDLVHNNYKVYQYSGSSVDQVTITCDFTAQDDYEANYLLAVIHFFRSMTKMFYGKDQNPKRGTPPPLCYMFGMGNYQFAAHPLAITGFSYNLPNDVDYIKTVSGSVTGAKVATAQASKASTPADRLAGTGADKGGVQPAPVTKQPGYSGEPGTVTWVPTKIQLSITCLPMMSRNQVSNKFSLKDYANGTLLNGIGKQGGGFW